MKTIILLCSFALFFLPACSSTRQPRPSLVSELPGVTPTQAVGRTVFKGSARVVEVFFLPVTALDRWSPPEPVCFVLAPPAAAVGVAGAVLCSPALLTGIILAGNAL